ncbi:hypothetical protein HYH03_003107 [Edaphochlamys debaryana]|uniref:Fungal lipase-type domain-containing protein n=1 Tax=Edaphochlamys debaryana TaxID=47281 RepID=A0A835Y9R9_9CHLO|nr:hypothetical protein HYH03_003107 [Edaphochlamys debaryana]|eukprot:KAG2498917.1 hypothetical protein HYH03_003107 [Edaphochlamys debaryana]
MAQATYDNLGQDPGKDTWGYNIVPAGKMIDYLSKGYPVRPGVQAKPPPGTKDMYSLPNADDLSPLIYAKAGTSPAKQPPVDPRADDKSKLMNQLYEAKGDLKNGSPSQGVTASHDHKDNLLDIFSHEAAKLPTEFIAGSRPLFNDGSRSAFMGYVAVSQPSGPDSERDAVFVWRGTIFKEEWAANFGQDKLVPFDPKFDQDGECPTADPHKPGVHDGFHDLYMRNARQPDPSNPGAVPALPKRGTKEVAPRTVVTQWLKKLQQEYNITTVTTTGHSLGGALSTLSAYDIGLQLKDMWADTEEAKAARKGWKTKAKPTVTAITFAAPRVGNLAFRIAFRNLKIKQLRICNVGDAVPLLPGTFALVGAAMLTMFNDHTYDDTDSPGVAPRDEAEYLLKSVPGKLGFKDRWDYHHVGTVLKVRSDKNFVDHSGKPLGATDTIGKHHNLEVYLYLLEKMGQPLASTTRNPVLLNKSDGILVDHDYPADWWRTAQATGYKLENDGRWQYPAKPIT